MMNPTIRCSLTPVRSGAPDAQLLVLGPSLGTTTELWEGVVGQLAENYRVLRFDLPGHGFSPAATEPFTVADIADAVIGLVDSVGGGAFHYAGVSLGGAVGLELALRHPERLLSLSVFCSAARIGTRESWEARAAQVRSRGTASVVSSSAERWFAPGFLDRDPGTGAGALDRLLQIDDESYALCCEALAECDLTVQLGSISVPTLCAAGELDQVTPPAQLRELARRIPGARYAVVAGVAHLPTLEHPVEVAALILEHVGGVAAIGASSGAVDAYTAGMAVRRAVLGDAHVDVAIAAITPETAGFQDFITRYAWGGVWARPGLDRRTRSFLTLACLVTGGHEKELGMHVHAALTNGLSRAEISEALLHTAIYAGVPAANSAFAVAREIFATIDAAAVPPAS
ncbi:MAG: bifunctional 3-oxoadipate enol-lactonase/4-carboxymuconolactone decarboxylase PcaDC [Lacisediminihabitans sp.]